MQESEFGLLGSDQRADGREWIRASQGQGKDAQISGSKPHTAAAFLWLGGDTGGKHRTKGTPTTPLAKSAMEKRSQKRAGVGRDVAEEYLGERTHS